MPRRRVPLMIGAAAALAVSITACKATSPKNTALVRFVNAVSNSGPLDFYANKTRDVNGLGFQSATSYFVVDSGQSIPFAIARLNAPTPVVTTSEVVTAVHTYTFMAADSMAGLTPLFIPDSNSAPDKSAVKLRFIHGAPSFPAVDIYIAKQGTAATAPTLSDLAFEHWSTYQLVSPGSYYVVATPPGNSATIVAVDTLSGLGNGTVRTIILMDSKKGGLPLATVTVNDVTR